MVNSKLFRSGVGALVVYDIATSKDPKRQLARHGGRMAASALTKGVQIAAVESGVAFGASLGTMICPGVGTAVGGIIGGALAYIAVGEASDFLADQAVDAVYDACCEPTEAGKGADPASGSGS